MEFTNNKEQELKDRMAAASPTTTVCDTTTATLPLSASDSSTQITNGGTQQHDYKHKHFKSLESVNEHQTNNAPFSSSTKNALISHMHPHIPVNHLYTNPMFSSNSISYQRFGDYQPSSPTRKRNIEKYQDETVQKESKRNKKSTEHTKHDKNSSYVDFHTMGLSIERQNHLSDDRKDVGSSKFENVDLKPFDEEIDMTSYSHDVMRRMGSTSTVPEEVRLRINSRERQRMHDLNTALDSLRQVMPYSSGPTVKKLSKMSTLLLARNYIVMLTRSLEEMKRLVQELSVNARPKHIPTSPLLPDPAYIASILAANHGALPATSLYLPPQATSALHNVSSIHCLSSTGAPKCACVDCQRKSLLAASSILESKKTPR